MHAIDYPDTYIPTKPSIADRLFMRHVCNFIPAFGFDGRLIGVCSVDPDCTVTLSYDEIVRRMNLK